MKLRILLSFVLGMQIFSLKAQDDTERARLPAPEFFLTTIPIRCALRDINIGFAHRVGLHHTLETRIGWVHSNKVAHKYYERWLNSSEMLFKGPSVYFQVNRWLVNTKGRDIYFGLILGYRHLWYHDKNLLVSDPDGFSYSEEITLSQWRNDILILGSFGLGTTIFTTSEISIGVRLMDTHSHVTRTRNYYSGWTQQQYDEYISATLEKVPYAEGFGITPIIRITSRFGWFKR